MEKIAMVPKKIRITPKSTAAPIRVLIAVKTFRWRVGDVAGNRNVFVRWIVPSVRCTTEVTDLRDFPTVEGQNVRWL